MHFHGANQCRTASADTQDHALRSAQSNACALLVSGVTETMQCEHQEPVSVKWLETEVAGAADRSRGIRRIQGIQGMARV